MDSWHLHACRWILRALDRIRAAVDYLDAKVTLIEWHFLPAEEREAMELYPDG